MNAKNLVRFAALCLLFLFAVNQSAQAVETKAVVVTGYGVDPDSATQNAWSNAISQVVGTLVDAQTVIENDQLVKDQVLSHSSGFIESFEVLNESVSGGLVTVQIKATVRLTQLQEKLQTVGLVKVEVDGVSLGAQLLTQLDEANDAEAMIREVLVDLTKLPKTELLGKPKVEIVDDVPQLRQLTMTYIPPESYQTFEARAHALLSEIAIDVGEGVGCRAQNMEPWTRPDRPVRVTLLRTTTGPKPGKRVVSHKTQFGNDCTVYRFSESQFPNELFADLARMYTKNSGAVQPQLQVHWTLWANSQQVASQEISFAWKEGGLGWLAQKGGTGNFTLSIRPFFGARATPRQFWNGDWDSLLSHQTYADYQAFVDDPVSTGAKREGFYLHEFVLPIAQEELSTITDMKLVMQWKDLQHMTPETEK